LRRLWPKHFAWRPPPYEYELERPAIDILAGSSRLREQIAAGLPLAEIEATWEEELTGFLKIRESYLLYRWSALPGGVPFASDVRKRSLACTMGLPELTATGGASCHSASGP
jgi:hypothetical protein